MAIAAATHAKRVSTGRSKRLRLNRPTRAEMGPKIGLSAADSGSHDR
jgi:hypothetical protein